MTVQPHSKDYRITEHIGADRIESVRSLWEQWQNHPNADLDRFSTIVKSRPNVVDPVALVVFNKDSAVAMAVGRLEKVPLPITFGYLKVLRSALSQLTIVYGGLMGMWDKPGAAAFIRSLQHLMRRDHIDVVHFAAIRHEHAVFKAMHRCVPFLLRNIGLRNNLHWWADVPATAETFLKKLHSKHRTQLRSKERKLAQQCGGTVRVQSFQTPEDVSLFCTTAEKIAQATYLRGLGEGFYHNEEMRNQLNLAACKGWMRGYVLYADEKPCAFWLGTLYRDVFYLDYTGFDTDLKDFAVGQILFLKMIEDICAAGVAKGIDFGFGDAAYKQRYGDRNWEESDLYLFNNTPAMILANLARKSATLLRTFAVKALKRIDLFTRIKKRWRRAAERAAGGHQSAQAGNE